MFSIQKKEEAGFKKFVLVDESSKTFAEIIPSCGAILHAFVAEHNGAPVNVIHSYDDKEDLGKNLTKSFRGSKLSPFVCRMNRGNYHFAGNGYSIEKFYLGNHAIHGLLYDRNFEVTGESADEAHSSVTMQYSYRAEDKGYPFNYDCIVMWKLEQDNRLSVTTECINRDQGLLPVQDGWHPYFTLGETIDTLQLEFQSGELIEFDDELIPTRKSVPYHEFNSLKEIGTASLDNCFKLKMGECQPLCVLRNPGKGVQVEIIPGKAYPYLQIYTPPHRQSIAIENLSGTPDAFNNGMGFITLEPGESAAFTTTYKISIL